jgi:hypothetical protein
METIDIEKIIHQYIKDNLEIKIKTEEYKSECSYSSQTFVELVLKGEVISSRELEGLNVDY